MIRKTERNLAITILTQRLAVVIELLQELRIAQEAIGETGQLDLFKVEHESLDIAELTKLLYEKTKDANFVDGFEYLVRVMQLQQVGRCRNTTSKA